MKLRFNRLDLIVHAAGILLGAFLGWLYYYKVGCVSGTCAIWANPWIATGYGALIGFAVAGLIPTRKKRGGSNETVAPSD